LHLVWGPAKQDRVRDPEASTAALAVGFLPIFLVEPVASSRAATR
jgi:hypothetical protein